jgi:hypothetical protein
MLPESVNRFHWHVRSLMRGGVNFRRAYLDHMAAETVISHNVITSGRTGVEARSRSTSGQATLSGSDIVGLLLQLGDQHRVMVVTFPERLYWPPKLEHEASGRLHGDVCRAARRDGVPARHVVRPRGYPQSGRSCFRSAPRRVDEHEGGVISPTGRKVRRPAEDRDRRGGGVAGRRESERSDNPIGDGRGEQRRHDGGAVARRPGDGVERDGGRLGGVGRIRLDRVELCAQSPTIDRPGPLRALGERTGTLTYMPRAARPASSSVDCCAKPPGANSRTSPRLPPRTATFARIRAPPFCSVSPASTTPSARRRATLRMSER